MKDGYKNNFDGSMEYAFDKTEESGNISDFYKICDAALAKQGLNFRIENEDDFKITIMGLVSKGYFEIAKTMVKTLYKVKGEI